MTLTEYELADLTASVQASTTPTTALLLTIMSGYLIVAWLAGAKLTRAQVSLINVLFVFFQFILIAGWVMRWRIAYHYSSTLYSLDPAFYPDINVAPIVALGIVMLVSIPACLKFMWDIRHPKHE